MLRRATKNGSAPCRSLYGFSIKVQPNQEEERCSCDANVEREQVSIAPSVSSSGDGAYAKVPTQFAEFDMDSAEAL